MSKIIIFDVETTGLPKKRNIPPKNYENWPHIVQFSWIIYYDKKITEKSFIVKPTNYIISKESSNIHGISHKDAEEKGVDIRGILIDFLTDCKEASLLIAHNYNFDINVICASCYRYNIKPETLFNKKKLCTMKTTTDLCKLPGKYGYKYPKLSELHFYLLTRKQN